MGKEKRWKKVEVRELITAMDDPVLVYRLPSGYPDKEIEVYEDAIETLTVRHVMKDPMAEAGIRGAKAGAELKRRLLEE